MITIFTIAFNEEIMLPFMIEHYRNRFSNCKIIIYNNQSTDKTKEIALNNKCDVIDWDTQNKIDDNKIRDLKNNCWKNATTDWVMVCDPDELLDINQNQLLEEEKNGVSIIRSKGYHMINMENNLDLKNIKYGIRTEMHDKSYLFNHKFINEINYNHGSHQSSPAGNIKYSDNEYMLYHYKYISPDFLVERSKYTFQRLSDINKKMGWGSQWFKTDEQVIQDIIELRKIAIKVI